MSTYWQFTNCGGTVTICIAMWLAHPRFAYSRFEKRLISIYSQKPIWLGKKKAEELPRAANRWRRLITNIIYFVWAIIISIIIITIMNTVFAPTVSHNIFIRFPHHKYSWIGIHSMILLKPWWISSTVWQREFSTCKETIDVARSMAPALGI